MNVKTIWKNFKLGELFNISSKHFIKLASKELDISKEKTETHKIANVTAGKENNGVIGYIEDLGFKNIHNGYLTISGNGASAGVCFYQKENFVSSGDNRLLEFKNSRMKKIADSNERVYHFIAKKISYIFLNNESYHWLYKPNTERINREFLLLPVIEVSQNDEWVWNENGNYYTLDVQKIEEIMDKVKKESERKTIDAYNAERTKYESERTKYIEGYKEESLKRVWKAYDIQKIFKTVTGRDSKIAQKNLKKSDERNADFEISIVTESKFNNGVGFYMNKEDKLLKDKIVEKGLTFGTQFGNCNYHNYPHFIVGNVNYLIPANENLKRLLNDEVGLFFASLINKIFQKSEIYGFTNKIDQMSFYREKIVLPVIKVEQNDEWIWEDGGNYYTLAVNTISYLYLSGMIELQNKKIKKYKPIF